ncbi:hypothetical protein J4Q44_G00159030 [Coregonus suidteri]|uniref:EF-hand domain-containing protein n=1 Tax=Coregonus suidteri TaxID=861788 RepID=A0AAN8LQA0_9TELE
MRGFTDSTHHHGNWCHDVRDILELAGGDNDGLISKKDFINSDKRCSAPAAQRHHSGLPDSEGQAGL